MKKSLILVGMLAIGYANAQEGNVGINTENPKATLDIQPSLDNAQATATTNQGIIAPKLSKARIAGIADENLVEGTLVYATDATYTGANTKVSKITEKGYYFYNGTEWVKAGTGSDINTNIYTSNGTLSEHRTVNMAGKNLYFTNNGRIGIGTTAPSSAITIDGTGGWNDDISINTYSNSSSSFSLYSNKYRGTAENKAAVEVGDSLGNFNFRGYNGTSVVNGAVINTLVSEVDGATIRTNLILNPSKNVGIGTNDPSQKLEVRGNILTTSGLMSKGSSNAGGWLDLHNTLKEGREVSQWRLYNMTTKLDGNKYTNGLHFWAYAADGTNLSSQMLLTDQGNLGIGFGSNTNTDQNLKERLEVNGKIRSTSLIGAGDRPVYADENGVLKIGVATSSPAVEIGSTTAMECNATNRGKMNFIQGADGKSDVFGICMKNANGNYYWGYMVGGNNPTNGTGAFGSGL